MTTFLYISGILMGTKDWPVKPDDKPFRKTDDLDGFLKLDIEYHQALAAAKSHLLPVEDAKAVYLLIREEYMGEIDSVFPLEEGRAYHLDVEMTEINTCELNCTEPKYCSCCMGKGHRALRITTPKA